MRHIEKQILLIVQNDQSWFEQANKDILENGTVRPTLEQMIGEDCSAADQVREALIAFALTQLNTGEITNSLIAFKLEKIRANQHVLNHKVNNYKVPQATKT